MEPHKPFQCRASPSELAGDKIFLPSQLQRSPGYYAESLTIILLHDILPRSELKFQLSSDFLPSTLHEAHLLYTLASNEG
jgi:hypothetical protein